MKLRNRTILVTGGAGFIGSHLVEMLVPNNRVIVYDNFSSSVLSVGDLGHLGNLKIVKGDILDEKHLARAMADVDIVFHFAVACVRLSLSNQRYVHDVNATGTLTTLSAAKKARVKRFIYISSSEVYGSSHSGRMSESHPIDPTTVYGMSKYMGELYTKYFFRHEGLPAIIVRPFNTYGPRSHFEGVYGEVIPRFVVRAINGKQPIIFGTGKQTRDFTYITDTVEGIIKAAQSDKLVGDVVNVAYGREVAIANIARIVCSQTCLPFAPIMKEPRPNDVMRHFANITKAKKLISYQSAIPITQGLIMYIAWVKKTFPNHQKLLKHVPDTNW